MTDLHRAVAVHALRLVPPDDAGRMRDNASTALQFACMAMVAMGVAVERAYGCDLTVPPAEVPERIDPAGLWAGDAARVLLSVAGQLGDMSTAQERQREDAQRIWRPVPGSKPMRQILEETIAAGKAPVWRKPEDAERWLDGQKRLLAHILRREEQVEVSMPDGPMRIHPEIAAPFRAMGWLSEAGWSAAAQGVLWRTGALVPEDAEVDALPAQPLPEDVAQMVREVWEPPDAQQVAARARDWWKQHLVHSEQMPETVREHYRAQTSFEQICEQVRQSWPNRAADRVRDAVEARWRAELGWDSGAALLPLFHDQLARRVAERIIEV